MQTELRHVLASQQFEVSFLEELFNKTDETRRMFAQDHSSLCSFGRHRLMYYVFWEASTRTRFSFTTAARHLGFNVEGTESAGLFSSAVKGETLEDTMRILSSYCPYVIVMRHKQTGAAELAANYSSVPIINAGDGCGQHPTQALLDVYTIVREIGRLKGLQVVIGGDLKRGRTVRSLAYLLGKYKSNKITFASAPQLRVGRDIKDYLLRHSVEVEETDTDFRDALADADVVYWTRTQTERVDDGDEPVPENLARQFTIGKREMGCMRQSAILMHPLPRIWEIEKEVDSDPRAAYFRQAENGMYVRMALLRWILGHW